MRFGVVVQNSERYGIRQSGALNGSSGTPQLGALLWYGSTVTSHQGTAANWRGFKLDKKPDSTWAVWLSVFLVIVLLLVLLLIQWIEIGPVMH